MIASYAPTRSGSKRTSSKIIEVRKIELTCKVAQSLLRSKSAATFLRRQGGRLAHEDLFALKREVDRLVSCDLETAERLADRVDELSRLMNDPLASGFAEAGRARVFDQQGRHVEANAMFEAAATRMRAAGFSAEAAVAQRQQVHSLFCLNRYNDALNVARVARRALGRNDSIELAQLEANVGNVYYRLERYNKALEHYDKALRRMSAVDDELLRAPTDFNRANIFLEMDRVDEAMSLLEGVAEVFERAGHHLQANQARFHIAYLHFKRGNYNGALASFYQVRDRLSELGSAELVAFCNQDIAEILLALNSFEDAAEAAEAARAHFKKLGMAYESAQARMLLALALMGLGRFDEAQKHLTEARVSFSRSRNSILTALTDTYLAELALRSEDYDEALRRARQASHVFARHRLATKAAYSRTLAARAAYRVGAPAKAIRMARAALDSVKGMFAPSVVYQCHHLIGLVERDRGRRNEARICFLRAVEAIEQMRGGIFADEFKASFLKDKIEIYDDAITACLDEGSRVLEQEAFRLVESSKSRALASLLARYARRPETGSGGPKPGGKGEPRARLRKLIEDLNWYSSQADVEDQKGKRRVAGVAERYRRRIAHCERQVTHLFRRLEVADVAFAEVQRLQTASASDLCDSLEAGETAVEYFIAGDEISAFVVTRDEMRVARNIASRREVESLLVGLRFQIEKFGYNGRYVQKHTEQLKHAIDESLTRLYEAVFEPLELMIASDKLIIIPHGLLHYVPFHALSDGQDYLADLFEISRAPSAAVLKLCRARSRQTQISNLKLRSASNGRRAEASANHSCARKVVALGVAERDTPHIDDEIRALAEIFPGAVRLTGDRATRKNLIRFAPEAHFLHLASHGYFRADNPMFSFLKLADSHLNFYSLLDLKLSADMVTLSACQTGVNAIFPGDELHGLMRGFLYAGAPSLVVSLWTVSDRSTAEFMGEMYRLLSAGASKRAALRGAQLRVKQTYPHPYYWAPFILIGNPN